MRRLRSFLRKRIRILSDLIALARIRGRNSYLQKNGWFDSYFTGNPVDADGHAIPWITYPALEFLKNRVRPQMSVFEYGSGQSTLWWSRRVARVVSCEHEETWYQRMRPLLAGNVEYLFCACQPGGDYSRLIQRFQEEFDIVVIDGRDRVNCAMNSLKALKPGGVVVWDNSERVGCQPAYDFLRTNQFRKLDFYGAGPIKTWGWCTSIFYRPDNCLGL